MDWSALDLADGRDDAEVAEVAAGSFQAILDKALLDAFLTAPDRGVAARQYLRHAHRLLQPGAGPLVIVSHGPPEQRLALLIDGSDAGVAEDSSLHAHLDEATAGLAAALTSASSPEQAVKRLTSKPVLELTGGAGRWSMIRVMLLPKPPVSVRAASSHDDDDDDDDDDDSTASSDAGADAAKPTVSQPVSVWATVATVAHFAYLCYA
jgi:hypothetical protein